MWWSRLLIGISVTTVCAATSLSTGSGRAAAFDPEEIFAVAREIAAPVAETWRLPAFKDDVESLIARQGTNLTPVLDESGLTRFRNELMSSSPRKPLPDEVVPVRGEVPSAYREAQQMLCETTVDLLTDPDQLSWKYGIKRVDDQILNQSPVGEKLVLYSELNEIADKFERGCICAATAEVEVFFAKKAVCEGVVSVV